MLNEIKTSVDGISYDFRNIIGRSVAMISIIKMIKKISNCDSSVLITGESGTGKEVVARAIHLSGNRKNKPFVAINCSAIPLNLLESELFGHTKGSFTGAYENKMGLFEEANGGTLLLDEIGDMDMFLQSKLLRVLQEKNIKRIGDNKTRSIDVRIISATHKKLLDEIKDNNFREDLYFRLNVIPLNIPPLRERIEDILPLAFYFLENYNKKFGFQNKTFTSSAKKLLLLLPWRGNVRELNNIIERAVVLSQGDFIDVGDIPALEILKKHISEAIVGKEGYLDIGKVLEKEHLMSLSQLTTFYIKHVMDSVHGVRERAAVILNIDRKTLYRHIKKDNTLKNKENLLL